MSNNAVFEIRKYKNWQKDTSKDIARLMETEIGRSHMYKGRQSREISEESICSVRS